MNFHALDRYLDSFYLEKNIPGAGVSVYQHGKLLHTYCTGYANVQEKRPFSDDTMINLYSATKISTCTAGLRMAERGELDLDAPLSVYLPEFEHMNVQHEDGSVTCAEQPILIRHLFSMSAGFSYNGDQPAIRRLKADNPAPTTREVIRAMAEEPLLFEPGTHFRYSFCHDVLAAVYEVIRGIPFSEILRQEIFEPLGMKNTVFHPDETQLLRIAPEYHGFCGARGTADHVILKAGVDMNMGPNYESGGGGLISCIRDYSLLASALANGGTAPNGYRLLRPETIDRMRTNQLTEAGLVDFDAMGGWSKAGYGYGLGVRTLMDRERNHSLSAKGEFGWDGALGCYLLSDPENGIGLFYAQQEGGSPWWTWHGMVRNYAYAAILGA
ncbi:MAG: beta-lactamase family protein [Clostridia bacterium]|nr:beta-lactamase family protein [Clostridia bacterium]